MKTQALSVCFIESVLIIKHLSQDYRAGLWLLHYYLCFIGFYASFIFIFCSLALSGAAVIKPCCY